jgi:hypothetical protein
LTFPVQERGTYQGDDLDEAPAGEEDVEDHREGSEVYDGRVITSSDADGRFAKERSDGADHDGLGILVEGEDDPVAEMEGLEGGWWLTQQF